MSSNRRRMVALLIPRICPYNQMFSRPVSSGWTAEPTSMSAATRPRIRTRPDVGGEMRAISFSAVLLPAPFGPMRAKLSPSCTSNETSRSARVPVSPAVLPRARAASRRLIDARSCRSEA